MYKKVNPDLNFVEREHNTLKFWQDNQIFEKSVKEREGCPTYMFHILLIFRFAAAKLLLFS